MPRKLLSGILRSLLCGILVVSCSPSPEAPPIPQKPEVAEGATPLRVAYDKWPGNFPVAIAEEKGWFRDEGVAVSTDYSADLQVQIARFHAGQTDVLFSSLGDALRLSLDGDRMGVRIIAGVDFSDGADAFVAAPGIATIADLKGRTVGLSVGGFSEPFLSAMLRQGGLGRGDVQLINLDGQQIQENLATGAISAGHTWEPFVTEIVSAGHGHVLFSSAQTPGLISDVILVRAETLRDRRKDLAAFLRAWFRAVQFRIAHSEESAALIARRTGLSFDEVSLKGLRLLTAQENRAELFNPDSPQSLARNAEAISRAMLEASALTDIPDIPSLLDASLLPPPQQ